jgi:putative aldouronate transport system substrate-binding protein
MKTNFPRRSILIVVLVVLLPVTIMANGSQESGAESTASAEPDRIKMFMTDNKRALPPVEAMEIPDIQYLAEQTNTYLDIDFQPHSDHGHQTRLKISAGDFPDVMQQWGVPEFVLELYENDQLMPMTEYIEASPNMSTTVPENVWKIMTMDGEIMGIPALKESAAGQIFYIRGDWLDEVGMDLPETSDDLLRVFRAFKEARPDAYPFSMRVNFSWGTNIFGMFGVDNNGLAVHDGRIIPQQVHPRMKDALAFFRTMYVEGLIDPEFLLNDSPTWQQKITSGKVGCWVHVARHGSVWHERVAKALPDEPVDVRTFPTPQAVGYNGPVGQRRRPIGITYWVHKQSKNPEAVARLFDWLFTEEGMAFAHLGIPEETYTVQNGNYVYDKDADDPEVHMWRSSLLNMMGYHEDIMRAKYSDPTAFEKYKTGIEIGRTEGLPNPAIGIAVEDALDLYMSWVEVAARIVVEGEPLSVFDKFVENWMKNGGKEEIERMTDWVNNK